MRTRGISISIIISCCCGGGDGGGAVVVDTTIKLYGISYCMQGQ